MKPKLNLVVLTSLLITLGGWTLVSTWRYATAPRHEGRTLSAWSHDLTAHPVARQKLLYELGPAIVPYLLHEIDRHYDPFDRDLSYTVSHWIYRHTPEFLSAYAPKPVPQDERRLNALILLGQLGADARAAVPTLIKLLDDESVSGSVVLALSAIGPDAQSAVPKLIAMLDEPSPWVPTALAKIDSGTLATTAALRRASTNGPRWFQLEAAEALWSLASLSLASNAVPTAWK